MEKQKEISGEFVIVQDDSSHYYIIDLKDEQEFNESVEFITTYDDNIDACVEFEKKFAECKIDGYGDIVIKSYVRKI